MRIEVQGKYVHAMPQKAQESLTFDMNKIRNLETTSAQVTDSNLNSFWLDGKYELTT